MKRSKFRTGKIVTDVDRNLQPRRICEVRNEKYWCFPALDGRNWFEENELRRLNKRERGK